MKLKPYYSWWFFHYTICIVGIFCCHILFSAHPGRLFILVALFSIVMWVCDCGLSIVGYLLGDSGGQPLEHLMEHVWLHPHVVDSNHDTLFQAQPRGCHFLCHNKTVMATSSSSSATSIHSIWAWWGGIGRVSPSFWGVLFKVNILITDVHSRLKKYNVLFLPFISTELCFLLSNNVICNSVFVTLVSCN